MKSKLTESQHIDICKPINLLNKKWGDKNPPQATQLWLKPHKKKQSSRESWKAKNCWTLWRRKKIVNTKRDANETAALVWTVTLNVWYKLERWQSIGKFGLKNCQPSSSPMTDLRNQHKNKSAKKKPPNIKTSETRDNANQVAYQWLTYPTGIITERAKSYEARTNASQIAAQWLTHSAGVKTEWIRLGTNYPKVS